MRSGPPSLFEPLYNEKLTIDELFRSSRKYQNSQEFIQFFDFIARFRHYSRYNNMLVYLQDKSVSFYGGANFWKKNFDRQVIEDAKPLIVLQPFGPVMLVYDVNQTIGKESPKEFIDKGLGQKLFEVKGKLSLETLKSAINKAIELGIKIKILSLSELTAGSLSSHYNGPLEITLNDKLSIEQNFATLLHELGHLFAGHVGSQTLYLQVKKGKTKELKLPDRKLPETAAELEAETISFLLCSKLGLETRSAEYLAGFIRNKSDLQDFSYELVVKTADKIEELFIKKKFGHLPTR